MWQAFRSIAPSGRKHRGFRDPGRWPGLFSRRPVGAQELNSTPFEVLNFPFVLFRRRPRGESPQISPFSGLGIRLSRVQAVLAGWEFSDHPMFL